MLTESGCSADRQAVKDSDADAETTAVWGWLWDDQVDQQWCLRVCEVMKWIPGLRLSNKNEWQ